MIGVRLLAAAGLALAGCSVSAVDATGGTYVQNTCLDDSECGSGGVCRDHMCQATSGTLKTVLFEITPSSASGRYSGVSFLKTVDLTKVVDGELDLSLTQVAEVIGSAQPQVEYTACAAAPVRVRVTLIPTGRVLGLPLASYSAQAELNAATNNYEYKLRVPPGNYDIYVQPDEELSAGDGCVLVPQLHRDQHIPEPVILPITLQVPVNLEVQVTYPTSEGTLTGWIVDVLDPVSGRVISNQPTLADSDVQADGFFTYDVSLRYSQVTGGTSEETRGEELLRLRPPEGVSGPTLLLRLAGLLLFDNVARIDHLLMQPHTVEVEARVEHQSAEDDAAEGVAAEITAVATRLDGFEDGSLTSFVRLGRSENDGTFSMSLLPGDYRVHVTPTSSLRPRDCDSLDEQPGLRSRTEEWEVAAEPAFQAGKIIQLEENSLVTGGVSSLRDTPLTGASVLALPSSCAVNADVLDFALGFADFAPRVVNELLCDNGRFAVDADPGIFDVSIRPPDGSGFPWLVWPSLPIPDDSVSKDLGSNLRPPLPVVFRGVITAPSADLDMPPQVLSGATIRAYVFIGPAGITDDPNKALSVFQVGETRTESEDTEGTTPGEFRLLLPATVTEAVPWPLDRDPNDDKPPLEIPAACFQRR